MATALPRRVRREHDVEAKLAIVRHLQSHVVRGDLSHGAKSLAAAHFGIHRKAVAKIWNDFMADDLASKKAGRVGKKRVYSKESIVALVRATPHDRRETMRDMASSTGLSLGTLHRGLKSGAITRKSSRLKPLLTAANMADRVRFCLSHVRVPVVPVDDGSLEFDDMTNIVHLDEKWFNADKDRRKIYVTEGEELPPRSCKSKRSIPKVMLLAAVMRPQWDSSGNCIFDGKIGFWAFTEQVPAQTNSRNRPAGTLVTKCVNVTADVYHRFVMDKVIPAVKKKWSFSDTKHCFSARQRYSPCKSHS
ncbi:hypothetical protein DYB25_011449 [Aphanomyces astaci]|uniref:Transposase Tc1-like domain-containing protein n=1 Tax=Aphanomyces astaci TaxID=112090 RepID=A0A397DXN1_APHAT|nr:hypothetical protein DYB25_011449 [Aphanomyces astaci]RHY44856.1 hypothetical protein DYB34_011540 [Aphanomyces astaci]RHY71886.1 hypothetical protein DYB30_011033 [Aphanomyces astaci]